MPDTGGGELEVFLFPGLELGVGPDVGDRFWGVEEECAAVVGSSDLWSDDILLEVGGIEGEGRFVFMFGVPGGAPGEFFVGWGVDFEDDDHSSYLASCGGYFFDVDFVFVEESQGLFEF